MSLPVYVLNLPDHVERRALVEAELARVGLAAEFVAGVDGAALSSDDMARYDARRCRAIYGVDMLPSEIGCYLGHERILRRFLEDGHEAALVLEDDIRLDDDLAEVLEALVASPRPWLVARLAGTRHRQIAAEVARRPVYRRLGDQRTLHRINTHPLGGYGYVLTRAGAERILAYGQRIFLPWDHALDRYWDNGIEPWVVYPFPVGHRNETPSIIGDRDPRRRYDLGGAALWRRRLNRWRDGVAKRWYAIRHP